MNSMKGICLAIVLCLVGLAGAVAPDSFDYHCATIGLLQDRSVQNEVGISQKQRDQMNKFAGSFDAQMKAYAQKLAGKQPDPKVMQGYMDGLKKQVLGTMTDAQIKRLRELSLQAAGLLGLLDPVVAKKVGMTTAQAKQYSDTYVSGKTSAAKILQAALLPIQQKYTKLASKYKGKEKAHQKELEKLQKDFSTEAGAAQKKVDPQVKAITSSTEKKLRAMLSAKQKATWTALQGKKFTPKPSKK